MVEAYDRMTTRPVYKLEANGGIYSLARDSEAKLIVTGTTHNRVLVWDAHTGKKARELDLSRVPSR